VDSALVQQGKKSLETITSGTVAPPAIEGSAISEGQSKSLQQTRRKSQHSRNRLSQFSVLRHRDSQNSIDSQLLEIQLFPGEKVTEANKDDIKRRLPTSIRAQCTYKDNFWWYDGDPGDLSGLTKDENSERARAGIGDSSKGTQPIIQKGNITIAGRPLLIERCFQKHKEAWTCEPDVNIMKDTPIPLYKDGETVVVHPQSIEKPPKFKWKGEDPIKRAIDPSKYSPTDLLDIANVVWPHEFCLWLDGTLQVMLNTKEAKGKTMTFPRKIGGLNVSFSDAIASSQPKPPRFRFSKVASNSVTSLRSLKRKTTFRDSKSSHPTFRGSTEDSARSPRPPSTNGGAISSINGLHKDKVDQTNIQDPSSNVNSHPKQTSTDHVHTNNINGAVKPSNTMNGSAKLPRPTVDNDLGDSRARPPHNPCEVVVGETFESGVSCFVGVKIRDHTGTVMITIPTSAALEAACKARKEHGVLPRIMDHVRHPVGKQVIDVIGLHVWTKVDPLHKVWINELRHLMPSHTRPSEY
jgi:hypothetical protein